MFTIYRWAFLNLIMKFHAYLGVSVICICRNISFPTSQRIQKLDIYLQTMYLGLPWIYEGCSNMNASGFITFFTSMIRQNDKRFYKALYVTFKLAPDLKTNTVYLSSYSTWNKGHVSILTNVMLWTYTCDRRAYNSSINRWHFLKFWRKYPHILI